MPFIRLRTETLGAGDPSIRFLDEQGHERVVPLLRLRLGIAIGKDQVPVSPDKRLTYDAILDTGSPLTIFPKHVWQYFASEITLLQVVSNRPPIARAGGHQFNRPWPCSGDADPFSRRRLPSGTGISRRRRECRRQPPILLGLWGGILEGRALTRWPTAERFDPDIPTLESFGQWWRLAEP